MGMTVSLRMGPAVLLCGILGACASSTNGGVDCVSHYEQIANAATKPVLKRQLLHDVDPGVRSLLVIDKDKTDDKVVVNLLNRRRHLVMSLEMWQRNDGTWTAQQWSQCID